jgi:PatG Domain
MEQSQAEVPVQTIASSAAQGEPSSPVSSNSGSQDVLPQACATCGNTPAATPPASIVRGTTPLPAPAVRGVQTSPSWVYAIGRIEARFPSISVEKEVAQAVGRAETKGLTDRETLHEVLSKPENAYLVRQLCWVMTIEGLETYLLIPRDSAELRLLVDALRPNPKPSDLDVVIGAKGPIAQPQMCNGLMVPIVVFDQIYCFDRETLLKNIPKTDKARAERIELAAGEVFDRIMLMTDNAGAVNYHRALNYLAVRYSRIYEAVAEAFARDESLSAVDVRPSPLSTTREIVEVVLSFTNRNTDVITKQFVRVDVTDEFPFLVTKLSPYFDR